MIIIHIHESFAGIRIHIARSLACLLGVLLYLAEVTYQDYYNSDREPLNITNLSTSQALGVQ